MDLRASLVVNPFDRRCADALALANSVALKLGRAAEGCPKAAELLKAASAEEEALRRKVRSREPYLVLLNPAVMIN